MRDHFGNELEIGQKVLHIYTSGSSAYANVGYVVGFMAKVSSKPDGTGGARHPHKLIIVGVL